MIQRFTSTEDKHSPLGPESQLHSRQLDSPLFFRSDQEARRTAVPSPPPPPHLLSPSASSFELDHDNWTMCSLMAKRISFHFFSPSPPFLHQYQQHHFVLLSPLLQQQQHLSTRPSPMPQKDMPFIAQYLVSSLGFSPQRALEVSMYPNLKGIKSSNRPEAVRKFLSDTGLSDAQIKAAVSIAPRLLLYNVDKILMPRVCEWVEDGFSEELVVRLIRYCPIALLCNKTLSRLRFWRDFASNDVDLLKFIPRIGSLILCDVDNHVAPRMNVLKEYGLSNRDIVGLLGSGSRCMNLDLDSLRQTIELIEELGLTRGSGMFLRGLKAVGSYSKDKILKKVEFYKCAYGWSQADVLFAFRKFPYILQFSEEKIKSNIGFLITKVKLEPRSIASQPVLLGYSVEKRLVPRHHVLSILAAKSLNKHASLATACAFTEQRFLEKYVEPYKKDVPELAQVYFAASGKNVSLSSM